MNEVLTEPPGDASPSPSWRRNWPGVVGFVIAAGGLVALLLGQLAFFLPFPSVWVSLSKCWPVPAAGVGLSVLGIARKPHRRLAVAGAAIGLFVTYWAIAPRFPVPHFYADRMLARAGLPSLPSSARQIRARDDGMWFSVVWLRFEASPAAARQFLSAIERTSAPSDRIAGPIAGRSEMWPEGPAWFTPEAIRSGTNSFGRCGNSVFGRAYAYHDSERNTVYLHFCDED